MEKKEMKGKNIIIGVLALVIVVLAGLCIYLLFIKKDEGVVDNNNNQNNVVNNGNNSQQQINTSNEPVKLSKIRLTQSNQNIKLKSVTVAMRTYDNGLYVNDKKIYTSDIADLKGYSVYYGSNLDYAIVGVEYENLCGTPVITIAINSKGEGVHVNRIDVSEHPDLPSCLTEIYTKNNKVFAKYNGEDFSTLEQFFYEVEFVLNN